MIKLGNNDISLRLGSDAVDAVYLGNTLVYSGGTPPTPPVPPTPIPYDEQYLTFVAIESGTFKFTNNSLDYSLDGGSTWTTLSPNTDSPTVNAGNKILWKATLTPSSNGIGQFSSTGQFDVEGNAMSLLYGDNFIGEDDLTGKNNAFKYLFSSCTGMTSAENLVLPATTLASNCYNYMFGGCTSLTEAPELLATTLAEGCYYDMFKRCTSLTTAPVLPAATLVTSCYEEMFSGCTNLNYIKCLATNIGAYHCTGFWVSGVAASGTFVKASTMTGWGRGNGGIPNNWTVQDNV